MRFDIFSKRDRFLCIWQNIGEDLFITPVLVTGNWWKDCLSRIFVKLNWLQVARFVKNDTKLTMTNSSFIDVIFKIPNHGFTSHHLLTSTTNKNSSCVINYTIHHQGHWLFCDSGQAMEDTKTYIFNLHIWQNSITTCSIKWHFNVCAQTWCSNFTFLWNFRFRVNIPSRWGQINLSMKFGFNRFSSRLSQESLP